MMGPSKRDVTFRYDDIKYIISQIKSGDSCSVVGVGSVGKSNLLQHLMEAKTQDYHIPGISDQLKLVLVDPNNMLETLPLPASGLPSSWAGYEIMVHRLYKAMWPFEGFTDEQRKNIRGYYSRLVDDNPLLPYVGVRHLERILNIMLDQRTVPPPPPQSPRKLVFIFDEFEEMLEALPPKFFQSMRGIRDDYKYQVSYITFTRRSLPQIIAENGYNAAKLEPFVELFTDGTRYLGPYSDEDAFAMLDSLSARKETPRSPKYRDFLLRKSGRFAGLLRASFELAGEIKSGTHESEAFEFLINQKAIKAECYTIWDSLSQEEHHILKQICDNKPIDPDDEAVELLHAKHLLKTEHQVVTINPPLFKEYVCRFATLE